MKWFREPRCSFRVLPHLPHQAVSPLSNFTTEVEGHWGPSQAGAGAGEGAARVKKR